MLFARQMLITPVVLLITLYALDAHPQAAVPQAVVATTDSTVTVDDVLAMFAKLPMCEKCKLDTRGHWERKHDARDIAKGIVSAVDGSLFGDRVREARVMATYAAFESELKHDAKGDCDKVTGICKSWGPYQLQGVNTGLACDPMISAKLWYARAKATLCTDLPEEERLASMASGNCSHGRVKVKHRWEVAESLASEGGTP